MNMELNIVSEPNENAIDLVILHHIEGFQNQSDHILYSKYQ